MSLDMMSLLAQLRKHLAAVLRFVGRLGSSLVKLWSSPTISRMRTSLSTMAGRIKRRLGYSDSQSPKQE